MRLLTCLLFATMAWGQTTHAVTLTWDDALNPVGTTYTIYRANGACSGTPTYAQIASGVVVKTYEDVGINPGKYCYVATANYGGEESEYSNSATAQVKPFKPSGLTVIVK